MTDLGALLTGWIPQQRWFTAKGRQARLLSDTSVSLGSSAGLAVVVHLIEVGLEGGTRQTYQVPLVLRRHGSERSTRGLIGTVEAPDGSSWDVHDGPHDPAYVSRLTALLAGGQVVAGDGRLRLQGVPGPDAEHVDPQAPCRVLSGEQSNTSVILDGANPLICKVFRVISPGRNPDVVVQSALTEGGSTAVPRVAGSVLGTWRSADGERASGDLAFVQEFLPGTRDAWRVAVDALAADTDFADAAHALGGATARVHGELAAVFPHTPMDRERLDRLTDALLDRLTWAVEQAPDLAEHADAARAALEAVRTVPDPPDLQRVHGDFHLGQVLDGGGERGWVLLDFEGEPLRPIAERSAPDLALRDVAGMLRSFDYAAGHLVVDVESVSSGGDSSNSTSSTDVAGRASAWADACRDAFCRGYASVSGHDPREDAVLLRALELDKALYEVVYETGNRPTWVPIPTAAVRRLLASPAPDEEHQPVTAPPTVRPVPREELDRIVTGDHGDPHSVLGLHAHGGALTLRTLRPHAGAVVAVLPDGSEVPLEHEHEGIFVGVVPGTEVTDYRLDVTYAGPDGGSEGASTLRVDDPYRFLPTLGEVDLHLIGEGRHEQLWTVLGAHVRRYPGTMGEVAGTSFALWAPHARGIRLVGDMNHWDGASHPMRALGSTGVWELFVPGVEAGSRYKFEITGADGHRRMKADPMARAAEVPPSTASVVTESAYTWQDDDWMRRRAETDPHQGPMTTYEVHLGSWREGLSYRELAEQLVDYVVETGFTHVELMPVMEHPYGPSWGYQVTGYYAPTSRFGSPDEFRYLVDALHAAGVGVILDWVPAHFPKDAFALARFDGQALYEHPDPRRGDQPDWGTHVFDLGRPQVKNFLVANALYWCEEFHVDGLRVDAVASMLYLDYSREDGEWLPNEYGGRENLQAVQLLQETNATVYRRVPGVVTIAEESTAWPGVTRATHLGGLGFGLKWNMGWMHDSLEYAAHQPVHRQWHHHQMTFSLMYAWSENYVLPVSHDEVVHGKGSLLRKMPGDRWQQLANVRAFLATMWAHPGKKLLFMGSEFAQEAEWADGHGLDWWLLDQPAHRGVLNLMTDLNHRYREIEALWSLDLSPEGFRWIDANDAAGNVFSFLRFGSGGEQDALACVTNFSGAPHHGYRIGLPAAGTWDEVLNTDAPKYGGSGVGNLGSVEAQEVPWHGLPASAVIAVPPLGSVWLRPRAAREGTIG